MNMNTHPVAVLFAVLVMFCSCTKNFDEVARNPNSPETVTPSLLFTQIALDLASPSYGKPFFYSSLVTRQAIWTEGIESYQYYFFDRASFYGYSVLRDVQKMTQEAERTNEEVYVGLGHFFNAWYFYDMTMTFGDIPYSDALKGETNGEYAPKYDLQEDVFVGILDQLEQANQMLAEVDGNLSGDVVYDNNIAKWRQAVNSFTLRVLISLSKRAGDSKIDVAGKFAQIIDNPNRYPIFTSNADNLQLKFRDVGGQRYPFWNSSFRLYPYLDEFFTSILKEKQDRRLFYYAEPTAKALSDGLKADDFNAYRGGDGTAGIGDLQALEAAKEISKVNERYYLEFDAEPYVQLGYAEQAFTIAEAAYRGWITADAAAFYNEGIRASMEFFREYAKVDEGLAIDERYIADYLASDAVAYDQAQGLEQIITQKYIASFLNSGWTDYYTYRRTGLPNLPVDPSTSLNERDKSMIPLRWNYPQKELDYNTQNVEEAIKRQFGEDNVNASMWLLK